VVLLHGFPEFWWSWRFQIAPLAAAGYRVVAPDLRGYNETERTGPYDLDTLSGDIASLIAHLGESRATIVGHDWGGAITWHLAAMRPDTCERAVVLNAPHPAVFGAVLRHSLDQLRRSWYMFFFQLPWLPERWLVKDGGGDHPARGRDRRPRLLPGGSGAPGQESRKPRPLSGDYPSNPSDLGKG